MINQTTMIKEMNKITYLLDALQEATQQGDKIRIEVLECCIRAWATGYKSNRAMQPRLRIL